MHAFHPHFYPIFLRRGSLREACQAVRQLMHAEHLAPVASSSTDAAATPSGRGKRKRVASFDEEGAAEVGGSDPSSLLCKLMSPRLGSFVQVMLCQRAHSVPFAEQRFAGKEVSVMNKYDGERVQIHVWRNDRGEATSSRLDAAAASYSAAASSSAAAAAAAPVSAFTAAAAAATSTYEAMRSASSAVDNSTTYSSPHSPFSVRIFSRSARNSTRDRCKCIPYILAALGLQPLPYDHHLLYEHANPAPPSHDGAVATAVPVGCKVEDEPFAPSVMPPLERPFDADGDAAPSSQLFHPPTAPPAAPFVLSAFAQSFESAIFDGELLVYNELSSEVEPFGGLRDLVPWGVPRVGTSGPGNVHRLTYEHRHHCLMLFDMLHLNGESMLYQRQKNRYQLLRHALSRPVHKFVEVAPQWLIRMPPAPGPADASSASFAAAGRSARGSAVASGRFSTGTSATSVADAAAASPAASAPPPAAAASATPPTLHSLYLECVSTAQEGLILKDASSYYVPNYRGHWLKLKKDYIAGFGDTVDLCIVGAVFGLGAQGGLLNCFTLAARRDDEAAAAGAPLHFQVLFDVGIGLTAAEQHHMHALLSPLCRPYTRASRPSWLTVPAGHKLDVVLRDPRRAPVAEVLGSGFLQGILRFPRIQRLKLGSDYSAALGLEEYCAIAAQSGRRLGPLERRDIEERMISLAGEVQHTGGRPRGPRESRLDYSAPNAASSGSVASAANASSSSSAAANHSAVGSSFSAHLTSAAKAGPSQVGAWNPPIFPAAPSIDLTLDSPLRLRRSPRRAAGSSHSVSASCVQVKRETTTQLEPQSDLSTFAMSLFQPSLLAEEEDAQECSPRATRSGGDDDEGADDCELKLDWSGDLEPLKEEEAEEAEAETAGVKAEKNGEREERKSDGKVKQEQEHAVARTNSLVARALFPAAVAAAVKSEFEGTPPLASFASPPRRSRKRRARMRSPPPIYSPATATPSSGGSAGSRSRTAPQIVSLSQLIDASPALSQAVTAQASAPPAQPARVNPKKEWECPFSGGRGRHSPSKSKRARVKDGSEGVEAAPGASPKAWRPCECRRHVWIDEGAFVGDPARQVLAALGFVLHEAADWNCDRDPVAAQPQPLSRPGVVVISDAQRTERVKLKLASSAESTPISGSSRCPPRPVWLVDSERFALKLGAGTCTPTLGTADAAALRKRLYSALAQALVASLVCT